MKLNMSKLNLDILKSFYHVMKDIEEQMWKPKFKLDDWSKHVEEGKMVCN
jgi:hypothetical protein